MNKILLLNAFTPAMLGLRKSGSGNMQVEFKLISSRDAQEIAKQCPLDSMVGHQGAADMYQAALGVPVKMNRVSVNFDNHSLALLGQYNGPRLAEGQILSKEELQGKIDWMLVRPWWGDEVPWGYGAGYGYCGEPGEVVDEILKEKYKKEKLA